MNIYIRCVENGKIIGRGSHHDDCYGMPHVVDSLPSRSVFGYTDRFDAERELKQIQDWNLFNLGWVKDFTFEIVLAHTVVTYEVL